MDLVKKTEITAFIPNLSGGGAQGVFVTIMNYYVDIGCKVKAVVGTLGNDVYSHSLRDSIAIEELGATSSKESLFKIIKYINDNEVEIAFAFSPEWAVNLVIARKMARKHFLIIGRCINTLSYEYKYAEGIFRRIITYRLVKMLYKKTDCVVAQSEKMKDDLVSNFGLTTGQIYTINNPLSDRFALELENSAEENRENYMLFVGRFEKQKGIDRLLKAFSNISDRKIKLCLYGKGSQEDQLKKLAEELGIRDRVCFYPFDKDIDKIYRKAKLTVMSSLFEGFPNVLSESIACGTPVVSFDLPSGPKEIIVNGVNGYLVEYLNEQDLTNKINITLDTNWDYSEIKKTARRFSKNSILPKYRILMETWSAG